MAKIVKRKPKTVLVVKAQKGGFFKKIWRGIKSGANWVNNMAKKTKIVSTLLPLIPHPAAKVAGFAAKQAGYGKKKKITKRKQVGGKKRKVRKSKQVGGKRSSALAGRMYLS